MSINEKKLYIGKMTCINCQNKIERKLKNTAGICRAAVSYSTGLADISYDSDVIKFKDIKRIIEKLGYEVLPEAEKPGKNIKRVIGLLAVIILLYGLLQWFGVLNLLVPGQLADQTMGYGMLFVIGLLTSVHCIAMCGGINISQCIPRGEKENEGSGLRSLRSAFLYNLGRVISYTAIGFLLGLLGMAIGKGSGVGLPIFFQGILKMAAGIVMVIMGINMLGIFPWLRRFYLRMPKFIAAGVGRKKAAVSQPLAVGLLNGLMPCGPLQSMQIVALATGNPFAGALSMFLFSLGTVPLMLGFGSLISVLGRKFSQKVMNIGAVLVVVLGLAMLSQGGSLSGLLLPDRLFALVLICSAAGVAASVPFKSGIYRMAGVAAAIAVMVGGVVVWDNLNGSVRSSAASEEAGESNIEEGVQVINSTLSPGRYPDITVQAGIPVKWVINAPAGTINGCNYKMLISEYGIEHEFTEGENIIEFTPEKTGTVQYTCWMGMIRGNIFVTEEGEEVPETPVYSENVYEIPRMSCCGGY